jgi:hypothetical protein
MWPLGGISCSHLQEIYDGNSEMKLQETLGSVGTTASCSHLSPLPLEQQNMRLTKIPTTQDTGLKGR